MIRICTFFHRCNNWLKKKRLQPIRVFLFHQVSAEFDETTMKLGDWTETSVFKNNIEKLQKDYTFISLERAVSMMKKDVIRRKRYAVLTSDDGWLSLKTILPWLYEQQIPVTLFLNPGYYDGKHFREKSTEKYLLQSDVEELYECYGNMVTIGLHGWNHTDATKLTIDEFSNSVKKSLEELSKLSNFKPYYAYTYGSHSKETDDILRQNNLMPVLIDGGINIDDSFCIHRELLDGKVLQ